LQKVQKQAASSRRNSTGITVPATTGPTWDFEAADVEALGVDGFDIEVWLSAPAIGVFGTVVAEGKGTCTFVVYVTLPLVASVSM